MRRNIAIHRGRGEFADAIEEMNEYLKIYSADSDAYCELADLYLQIQEYRKAAFCYEELILSKPFHHLYHLKYAEILYTLGDFLAARKYYAKSLELNPDNNMRALWGLLMVRSNVAFFFYFLGALLIEKNVACCAGGQ